jgi:hypothetical protein
MVSHSKQPEDLMLNTAQMRDAIHVQAYRLRSPDLDEENIIMASAVREVAAQKAARKASEPAKAPVSTPTLQQLSLPRRLAMLQEVPSASASGTSQLDAWRYWCLNYILDVLICSLYALDPEPTSVPVSRGVLCRRRQGPFRFFDPIDGVYDPPSVVPLMLTTVSYEIGCYQWSKLWSTTILVKSFELFVYHDPQVTFHRTRVGSAAQGTVERAWANDWITHQTMINQSPHIAPISGAIARILNL